MGLGLLSLGFGDGGWEGNSVKVQKSAGGRWKGAKVKRELNGEPGTGK
jgi:hypothetical protein